MKVKLFMYGGLCPLINYLATNEIPSNYIFGNLTAMVDNPIPGISYRLNEGKRWPIYINQKEGWVGIGDPKTSGESCIEFIPNCVAVLHKQEMIALWLKPRFLPREKK